MHETYAALIQDPELDAVYVSLPNSLHAEWSIRALRAGKHVLCEKPLASNAEEAQQMAATAAETGRVLLEAFHYRYHPLAARMKEIVDGGELGTIRHLEAHFCVPLLFPGNIRYRFDLAGGATMDLGCYAVNLLRYLSGAEPQVTTAQARLASAQVDRCMEADLRFPGEGTFTHQLRAFVRTACGQATMATDAVDAIANTRVIDAIYVKAGLKRRGTK